MAISAGDAAAARSEAAARARIIQIYANKGVPVPGNLDALAARAVELGGGYFDTVRNHAKRDLASRTSGYVDVGIRTDPSPLPGSTGSGTGSGTEETRDFAAEAALLFSWLPAPVLQRLQSLYVEHDGRGELALAALRADKPFYDTYFPGNRRADGTLRFSEEEYFAEISGYEEVLTNFGISPNMFRDRFADMVAGDLTAAEFQERVQQTYVMVASQTSEIRRYFAQHFGNGNVSDAAILASAMDPNLDVLAAQQQLQQAQIGGAAAESGFAIDLSMAQRLVRNGLDLEAGREIFRQANRLMPTLGALVSRHNDPDDDFSLDEFLDAAVFLDPDQSERIERLFAQESSLFSPGLTFNRSRSGGVSGLRAR